MTIDGERDTGAVSILDCDQMARQAVERRKPCSLFRRDDNIRDRDEDTDAGTDDEACPAQEQWPGGGSRLGQAILRIMGGDFRIDEVAGRQVAGRVPDGCQRLVRPTDGACPPLGECCPRPAEGEDQAEGLSRMAPTVPRLPNVISSR